MPGAAILAKFSHPKWGACELVRVEGSDWIVRLVANGKLYRVPPNARTQLVGLEYTSEPEGPAPQSQTESIAPDQSKIGLATIRHPELGLGNLLRVEIADWLIQFHTTGKTYRYSPHSRSRLTVIEDRTPNKAFTKSDTARVVPGRTPANVASPSSIAAPTGRNSGRWQEPSKPCPPNSGGPGDDPSPGATRPPLQEAAEPLFPLRISIDGRQRALRVIESLRTGLPPLHADARQLAVGFEQISVVVGNLLTEVASEGGRAAVIQGAYGQGKTFALKFLEESALEANFVVIRTEIDATENRLNKPHHIYRDLLAHIRVPGVAGVGRAALRALVLRATDTVKTLCRARPGEDSHTVAFRALDRLKKELDCPPIAWILSDPAAGEKQELLGLLACDANVSTSAARNAHVLRGSARDWPAFNAGTQGDFASFLVSGLGRLCRLLGFQGLIVVMDEMEKWQDLNWKEQSQAGNLLGGLVWGATAELGRRRESDEPAVISHSLRSGGFPFTTNRRNHVGVAIAMTPRGDDGPESLWREYGMLEMVHLPEMTPQLLTAYCERLAPHYATATGLPSLANGQVSPIALRAVTTWTRRGEFTVRSAIQAAVASFDEWRDQVGSISSDTR